MLVYPPPPGNSCSFVDKQMEPQTFWSAGAGIYPQSFAEGQLAVPVNPSSFLSTLQGACLLPMRQHLNRW